MTMNTLFDKLFSFYLYNYDCAGSLLLHRLFSSCSKWELLCNCSRGVFSLWWLLLLLSMGSGEPRLSNSCSLALESLGLVAPQPVGSSQIRDCTHVSYIARWILYH